MVIGNYWLANRHTFRCNDAKKAQLFFHAAVLTGHDISDRNSYADFVTKYGLPS